MSKNFLFVTSCLCVLRDWQDYEPSLKQWGGITTTEAYLCGSEFCIEISVTRKGRASVDGQPQWRRSQTLILREVPRFGLSWNAKLQDLLKHRTVKKKNCSLIWMIGYQMSSGGWLVTSPWENGSDIWPRENPRRLINMSKINYKGTKSLFRRR